MKRLLLNLFVQFFCKLYFDLIRCFILKCLVRSFGIKNHNLITNTHRDMINFASKNGHQRHLMCLILLSGTFFLDFMGVCGLFCLSKQVWCSITVIPLLNEYSSENMAITLNSHELIHIIDELDTGMCHKLEIADKAFKRFEK